MKTFKLHGLFSVLLFFCALSGCEDKKEEPKTVLELNYDSLYFSAFVTQSAIDIIVNKDWRVENVPEWVTVEPNSGVRGSHTLNVSAVSNPDVNDRNGFFSIVSEELSKNVVVNQTEKPVIIASKKQEELSAQITELVVIVGVNVNMEVAVLDGGTWIWEVKPRSVSNRNVYFGLKANETENDRTARLVFRNTSLKLADTVTVTQFAVPVLEVNKFVNATYNQTKLTIPLKTNQKIILEIPSDQTWLKSSSDKAIQDEELSFSLEPNNTGKMRETTLTLRNERNTISVAVNVKQGVQLADGDVITVQKATKGKGIDLILMGDGFVQDEIASMAYQTTLDEGIEHFFSVEPFKSFREYFNVYEVVVVSKESGMTNNGLWPGIDKKNVDTRLKAYQRGSGAEADHAICMEYAEKARINSTSNACVVVVVANFPYYCGSTFIADKSLAILGASKQKSPHSYKDLITHEAGGHAFGWLADEYNNNKTEIPQLEMEYGLNRQVRGIYSNVCFYPFPQLALWNSFISHPKYPEIGFFEGGWTWGKGVWRSTETSIMRDMAGEFNAPSRAAIVKRIKELAGETFSLEDFIENDKLAGKWSATQRARNLVKAPPIYLPSPIILFE